jgi:hypothetical protein
MLALVLMVFVIAYPLWSLLRFGEHYRLLLDTETYFEVLPRGGKCFEYGTRRILVILSVIVAFLSCNAYFTGYISYETFRNISFILVGTEILATLLGTVIMTKGMRERAEEEKQIKRNR